MATTLLIKVVKTTVLKHSVHPNMPSEYSFALKQYPAISFVGYYCTHFSSFFARYIGFSESVRKEDSKPKQRKEKESKDEDGKTKNQADGAELTDIKVEVTSNHTSQKIKVRKFSFIYVRKNKMWLKNKDL